MTRSALVAVAVSFVLACSAASSSAIITPTGKRGFRVECDEGGCEDEAHRVCPTSYVVEEKNSYNQTYGRRGQEHAKERWIVVCAESAPPSASSN